MTQQDSKIKHLGTSLMSNTIAMSKTYYKWHMKFMYPPVAKRGNQQIQVFPSIIVSKEPLNNKNRRVLVKLLA